MEMSDDTPPLNNFLSNVLYPNMGNLNYRIWKYLDLIFFRETKNVTGLRIISTLDEVCVLNLFLTELHQIAGCLQKRVLMVWIYFVYRSVFGPQRFSNKPLVKISITTFFYNKHSIS